MSLQSHLYTLQAKHAELETSIAEAMARPSADFLAITEMKKKKLAIKQEIERFSKLAPAASSA